MNLRETFLEALAHDEDDTAVRLVFADWLEDQGEHEEADRQRRWPAAKEWLNRFCEENNPDPPPAPSDPADPGDLSISYQELLRRARTALEESAHGPTGIDCGRNDHMCDALRAQSRTFWKNIYIVTGVLFPVGAQERIGFGCSC